MPAHMRSRNNTYNTVMAPYLTDFHSFLLCGCNVSLCHCRVFIRTAKFWDCLIPVKYLQCFNPWWPVSYFPFSPAFLSHMFFLFFYCFITTIVTGDQSPSSPASRWPGANYGNRTLGVCLLYRTYSAGCLTHICLVKAPKLSWSTTCRVLSYCIQKSVNGW